MQVYVDWKRQGDVEAFGGIDEQPADDHWNRVVLLQQDPPQAFVPLKAVVLHIEHIFGIDERDVLGMM